MALAGTVGSDDRTQCGCAPGFSDVPDVPSGALSATEKIRLADNYEEIKFDENGWVQGRVEVFHDGEWGTVCDDSFGNPDAEVACRQLGNELGYEAVGWDFLGNIGSGSGQIWMDDLYCSGHEDSLSDCSHRGWGSHNCGHSEDAWVSCQLLAFHTGECEPCAAGSYGNFDTGGCVPCELGGYSETSGSSSCTPCEAGSIGTAVGATSADTCTACPAGTFPNEFADACETCPPGSAVPDPSVALSTAECETCPSGSASPDGTSCTECVAGEYANIPLEHAANYNVAVRGPTYWSYARAECQALGMDLPVVHSQAENDALQRIAAENSVTSIWLGGTDSEWEGDWYERATTERNDGAGEFGGVSPRQPEILPAPAAEGRRAYPPTQARRERASAARDWAQRATERRGSATARGYARFRC
jgi:hypothetical protein